MARSGNLPWPLGGEQCQERREKPSAERRCVESTVQRLFRLGPRCVTRGHGKRFAGTAGIARARRTRIGESFRRHSVPAPPFRAASTGSIPKLGTTCQVNSLARIRDHADRDDSPRDRSGGIDQPPRLSRRRPTTFVTESSLQLRAENYFTLFIKLLFWSRFRAAGPCPTRGQSRMNRRS